MWDDTAGSHSRHRFRLWGKRAAQRWGPGGLLLTAEATAARSRGVRQGLAPSRRGPSAAGLGEQPGGLGTALTLEETNSDFHLVGEWENTVSLNTDAQFIANFIGLCLFSKLICITAHFRS